MTDTNITSTNQISRRGLLAGLGGAGTAAVAGCTTQKNQDHQSTMAEDTKPDWYDGNWPPTLSRKTPYDEYSRVDLSTQDYNWVAAVYTQLAYEEQQKQTDLLEEIRDALIE